LHVDGGLTSHRHELLRLGRESVNLDECVLQAEGECGAALTQTGDRLRIEPDLLATTYESIMRHQTPHLQVSHPAGRRHESAVSSCRGIIG